MVSRPGVPSSPTNKAGKDAGNASWIFWNQGKIIHNNYDNCNGICQSTESNIYKVLVSVDVLRLEY